MNGLREAAPQLGISLLGPPLESPIQGEEYRRVLGAMTQEHVDGVIVGDQGEHFANRQLIVDLVRAARLLTIFPFREYFEIGALIVYGPSISDLYRRLAVYIDQILKGAYPGDLPIYLASKFDLLINLKTAKALGITIPTCARRRGDRIARRFPPPWTVEDIGAAFVVKDSTEQQLAYVYFRG